MALKDLVIRFRPGDRVRLAPDLASQFPRKALLSGTVLGPAKSYPGNLRSRVMFDGYKTVDCIADDLLRPAPQKPE